MMGSDVGMRPAIAQLETSKWEGTRSRWVLIIFIRDLSGKGTTTPHHLLRRKQVPQS